MSKNGHHRTVEEIRAEVAEQRDYWQENPHHLSPGNAGTALEKLVNEAYETGLMNGVTAEAARVATAAAIVLAEPTAPARELFTEEGMGHGKGWDV